MTDETHEPAHEPAREAVHVYAPEPFRSLSAPPRQRRVFAPTMGMLFGIAVVLAIGAVLYVRATGSVNKVALASAAKPVGVVTAEKASYQPSRRYVGAVEPWVEAKIGPQLVSAYADTVLVRPGDIVKRGAVIATLDCRDVSAANQAVAMQARALAAQQQAAASEAQRTESLLAGKYVSQNEVDQKQADALSKQAQLLALQAQAAGTSLQVNDCVLRAPFDGEIGMRQADPGAFVRPGLPIATVVDRHILRITTEVPEEDFDIVAPGNEIQIHFLAVNKTVVARIARRAPSADQGTRTAHIEIDFPDPQREIPTWTTAELSLDVGKPIAATAIPMTAATVRGEQARIFTVDGDVARSMDAKLLGERDGVLYLDPSLAPGTRVVSEGHTVLEDKDRIAVGGGK
jgi:RND family efflux transporter MFP subunit